MEEISSFSVNSMMPPLARPGKMGMPNPDEIFNRIDSNGDGSISVEELDEAKSPGEQPRVSFETIDIDGDGSVSSDEFAKHLDAMRTKMMSEVQSMGPTLSYEDSFESLMSLFGENAEENESTRNLLDYIRTNGFGVDFQA